jgi:hypothetical protein
MGRLVDHSIQDRRASRRHDVTTPIRVRLWKSAIPEHAGQSEDIFTTWNVLRDGFGAIRGNGCGGVTEDAGRSQWGNRDRVELHWAPSVSGNGEVASRGTACGRAIRLLPSVKVVKTCIRAASQS